MTTSTGGGSPAKIRRVEVGARRRLAVLAAKVVAGTLLSLVGGVLGAVYLLGLDWNLAILSAVLFFSWPWPLATYLHEEGSVPYSLRPHP